MSDVIPIHLSWHGPYRLDEDQVPDCDDFTNIYSARGIYQIYGSHPVYGPRVLLYIGKACDQTFWDRLTQHGLADWTSDRGNLEIYLGRMLANGDNGLTDAEWAHRISVAEGLLIYAHCPAFNSVNIQNPPTDVAAYRVFSYGCYSQLMEEVSGERWDPESVEKIDDYGYFEYGKR